MIHVLSSTYVDTPQIRAVKQVLLDFLLKTTFLSFVDQVGAGQWFAAFHQCPAHAERKTRRRAVPMLGYKAVGRDDHQPGGQVANRFSAQVRVGTERCGRPCRRYGPFQLLGHGK